MYQKLSNQAENLKGLWVAKMNLKGRSALATEEDLEAYERKNEEVDTRLLIEIKATIVSINYNTFCYKCWNLSLFCVQVLLVSSLAGKGRLAMVIPTLRMLP